jgi:hypothetical protein
MHQFVCVQENEADVAYMPLHGFTAVDLGYQPGDAISNLVLPSEIFVFPPASKVSDSSRSLAS